MKLKKHFLVFFLEICLSHYSYSQRIDSLFLLLPPQCTPDLNYKEREILISKGEYMVPGGDSAEMEKYKIEKFLKQEDDLVYSDSYTTGQRGFSDFEIRKFKKKDGGQILIYSKYSGTPVNFSQHTLYSFEIKNGDLKMENKYLSFKIDPSLFLKKETPDSIKKNWDKYFSFGYNLYNERDGNIEFNISTQSANEDSWLLAHSLEFIWDGEEFKFKGVK